MNMNMNKKTFGIIIGTIAVLIVVVLIGIVIANNHNEKVVYSGNIISQNVENSTKQEEQNIAQNNTTSDNTTAENDEKIEGEISYAETKDGGKIPVPPTFKYVDGESQKGAIIEDENGNQFVWVPVDDYNSYHREYFAKNGEKKDDYSDDVEVTFESSGIKDINYYNEEFDDSIRNYKGFYIARYEAGKEKKGNKNVAVSKAGVLPWTQIVWEEARDASLKMYAENDKFQTDLVNSYAWDTTCNWLRNTGINIDNSVNYGNYQNSSNGTRKVVETASNERWQTNNIFDMAGNVWEYTTEEIGDHEKHHIGRGGAHWNNGDEYPISSRAQASDESNLDVGFRVVLYLK